MNVCAQINLTGRARLQITLRLKEEMEDEKLDAWSQRMEFLARSSNKPSSRGSADMEKVLDEMNELQKGSPPSVVPAVGKCSALARRRGILARSAKARRVLEDRLQIAHRDEQPAFR